MKWKTERIMKIITKKRSERKSLSDQGFYKLAEIFTNFILWSSKDEHLYLGKEECKIILDLDTCIFSVTFYKSSLLRCGYMFYLGIDADNCSYREGFYIGY